MKNIDVVKGFYDLKEVRSSNGNLFTCNIEGNLFELVNYSTVIAYMNIGEGIVHLNVRKYSSTTSAIQTMLIEEGVDSGYKFVFYKGGY